MNDIPTLLHESSPLMTDTSFLSIYTTEATENGTENIPWATTSNVKADAPEKKKTK